MIVGFLFEHAFLILTGGQNAAGTPTKFNVSLVVFFIYISLLMIVSILRVNNGFK